MLTVNLDGMDRNCKTEKAFVSLVIILMLMFVHYDFCEKMSRQMI
jgi:hypothetical protein